MRKVAALAAIIAGGLFIASGVLSWDETGLTDTSTGLWWGGVGVFALTSALVGYLTVTSSPVWLRLVLLVCTGALGGSVVSVLDTEQEQAPNYLVYGGTVLVLLGLIGVLKRKRKNGADAGVQRGGRRIAR